MKDLVIIGAGGLGREIYMHVENIKKMVAKSDESYQYPLWNVVGFIDDNVTQMDAPYKYLGNLDDFLTMEPKPHFFVAIANSAARQRIAQRCVEAGCQPGSIIYPSALIDETAVIGDGCYIGDRCGISVNVKIGNFNIMQHHCGFGHDVVVGDFNSFMGETLIGGETTIGNNNYFGLRCTVINRINITDRCTFGACACVVKDAVQPGTYAGVPAVLKKPLQE